MNSKVPNSNAASRIMYNSNTDHSYLKNGGHFEFSVKMFNYSKETFTNYSARKYVQIYLKYHIISITHKKTVVAGGHFEKWLLWAPC